MSWKQFFKPTRKKIKFFLTLMIIAGFYYLAPHIPGYKDFAIEYREIYVTIFHPISFLKSTIFLFGLGDSLILLGSYSIAFLLGQIFSFLGFLGAEILAIISFFVVSTLLSILYLYFFSCLIIWIYNKVKEKDILKNQYVFFPKPKINVLVFSLFFVLYYLYSSYMLDSCLVPPHSLPFYCKSFMVPIVFMVAYLIAYLTIRFYESLRRSLGVDRSIRIERIRFTHRKESLK